MPTAPGPWCIYIVGEDGPDIYLQLAYTPEAVEHLLNAVPMRYAGRRAYAVPYQAEVRPECSEPRDVQAEIAKWQRAYEMAEASREPIKSAAE